MTILLSTCPPPRDHEVLDIVGAVGVSHKSFMRAPDLTEALEDCRNGLRLHAEALGADMVAGCHFQVILNSSVANISGFGTAVRLK